MPEGHTIHRLAAALSELYVGRRLRTSSPQGRFSDGAARLDKQILLGAEAHGKHLFLAFGPQPDMPLEAETVVWLRIHLGLYGSWTFDGDSAFTAPHAIGAPRRRVGDRGEHALRHGGGSALAGLSGSNGSDGDADGAPAPGQWSTPEPRGAVRLRLLGEHGVADLTGPAACELLNAEEVAAVHGRLGPDPLRADADPDEFVAGAQRRRKAVGELLMDQSVISGVGNIFRAETLLRCGINPFLEGNRLSREQLLAIWDDLVPLMEYGVATGFITTVDPDDVPQPLPDDDPEAGRWYVYHRAGRALFWCPGCQCCQS